MKNVKYNNGPYNVAMQGIGRAKTRTYQEVCIYPEIEFILYDWCCTMEYTCTIDPSDDNFIFPEFAKTFFNSGESTIDSEVSHMFQKFYENFYGIVQQYRRKWLKYVLKIVIPCTNNVFTWFENLSHASNMLR